MDEQKINEKAETQNLSRNEKVSSDNFIKFANHYIPNFNDFNGFSISSMILNHPTAESTFINPDPNLETQKLNENIINPINNPIINAPVNPILVNTLENVQLVPRVFSDVVINPLPTLQTQAPRPTPKKRAAPPRPRAEKNSKGLRHFSQKVMEKVKSQGKTTYSEVADDLVREFGLRTDGTEPNPYDYKNIRRRVYDALNVLMAMQIIRKEKKEISWVGFPLNTMQEVASLEAKRESLMCNLRGKLKSVKDLMAQHVAINNLIEDNVNSVDDDHKINLPFAAIATAENNNIECSVSDERDEYLLTFDAPFEVYDDASLVKYIGSSNEVVDPMFNIDLVKYKKILPKTLHPYAEILASVPIESFEEYVLGHREYLMNTLQNESQSGIDVNNDSIFVSKLLESCNIHNSLNSTVSFQQDDLNSTQFST